jgi:hypothetical protein
MVSITNHKKIKNRQMKKFKKVIRIKCCQIILVLEEIESLMAAFDKYETDVQLVQNCCCRAKEQFYWVTKMMASITIIPAQNNVDFQRSRISTIKLLTTYGYTRLLPI